MEYLKGLYSGRLNRRTYLVGLIIYAVVYWLLAMIFGGYGNYGSINPIQIIVDLIVVLFALSFGVKRWHDLGKSGWYMLIFLVLAFLMFIPFVNLLALIGIFGIELYLLVAPGKSGSNAYGPQPADALEIKKLYQYKY